ncbi:hypothetical protein M8494_11445 [Serratia ureilytica]
MNGVRAAGGRQSTVDGAVGEADGELQLATEHAATGAKKTANMRSRPNEPNRPGSAGAGERR